MGREAMKSTRRPLRRLVAFAASTCALVAIGAAANAGAEAPVPVEGPWSGVTSIGLPVNFRVEGGNVVDAHFGFNWGYCGNFNSHDQNTDPIDPEGHWSFDAPEGQAIEGTFVAPDRVEGTVTAVSRMTPGCPATRATFVAVLGEVPPPAPVQIYAVQNVNTGHQERKPVRIFLGRGSSFLIRTLRWENFGKSIAHATGEAEIQRFKRERSPLATVTLSRLVSDGPGKKVYSLLRFTLRGGVPPGYPRKGWFKFDRHGLVSSSDGRWPGGPGYTGKHHRRR
jgi:hypothetical protein